MTELSYVFFSFLKISNTWVRFLNCNTLFLEQIWTLAVERLFQIISTSPRHAFLSRCRSRQHGSWYSAVECSSGADHFLSSTESSRLYCATCVVSLSTLRRHQRRRHRRRSCCSCWTCAPSGSGSRCWTSSSRSAQTHRNVYPATQEVKWRQWPEQKNHAPILNEYTHCECYCGNLIGFYSC